MTAVAIATLLRGQRFTFNDELQLQGQIERVLLAHGVKFEREKPLSRADRPDFFVAGVAVEVKVRAGSSAILRQLKRYCDHASVSSVVIVTARALIDAPPTLSGKPLHYVHLWRSGLC